MVGDVTAGSVAASAGLRSGDEIRAINGTAVGGVRDLVFGLLDAMSSRGQVTLGVRGSDGDSARGRAERAGRERAPPPHRAVGAVSRTRVPVSGRRPCRRCSARCCPADRRLRAGLAGRGSHRRHRRGGDERLSRPGRVHQRAPGRTRERLTSPAPVLRARVQLQVASDEAGRQACRAHPRRAAAPGKTPRPHAAAHRSRRGGARWRVPPRKPGA